MFVCVSVCVLEQQQEQQQEEQHVSVWMNGMVWYDG